MKSYGAPHYSPLSASDPREFTMGLMCIILTFAAKQGHNMDLNHHNDGYTEYEKGDRWVNGATSWGPIMGASFGAHVSSFYYPTKERYAWRLFG